jgi:UDP-N-acetylglucosamine 1-carboxyvinyltransferase
LDIHVQGKCTLHGTVGISSAKNAILPVLAAALLAEGTIVLNKIPDINDVKTMSHLLAELGLVVRRKDDQMEIAGEAKFFQPPYELVRKIRASFLVMGPLLARYGKATISLPGGCDIGNRPIDLHLKGLKALGANISFSGGNISATASQLRGCHIYLDFPSVGATENLLIAASLAQGTTYIENAALEPEVVDLARFINSMGGKISGAGTNLIKIEGVGRLGGTQHTVIPDRIEAGSFMVAAAATGGKVTLTNVVPEHLKAISAKLAETGADIIEQGNTIIVSREKPINPVYIKTLPYPGFPTDMQAQFMAYLCRARGTSVISESVFENRFMHVSELERMGANIKTEGKCAIIKGTSKLSGSRVKATDLRAGAALIIAALTASGTSIISDCEHIDRGYENIVGKLNLLGARITRV